MSRRALVAAVLTALCLGNGYNGLAKIEAFRHGFRGVQALSRADLNLAYASLKSSVRWQADDSAHNVMLARTVATAQANGLPLEALAGRSPLELLGAGVAAAGRGIALNPNDAWSWFNLAECYLGYGRGKSRLDRMRRAGEAAATGAASAAMEEPPATAGALAPEERIAVAATSKARELEPDFFMYPSFLAGFYWGKGLRDDAAREIRAALALMPRLDLHPVLERPGLLEELAGPALEGLASASVNPFLDPEAAARARTQVLERIGRLEEALGAAGELCRMQGDEGTAECGVTTGRILLKQGRTSESVDHFARAARSDPRGGFGAAAMQLEARAHSRMGDHARAVELMRAYLARHPVSVWSYLDLGRELEALGRLEEAEGYLVTAVRKFPDAAPAYESLIALLTRAGKKDQAALYGEAMRRRGLGAAASPP